MSFIRLGAAIAAVALLGGCISTKVSLVKKVDTGVKMPAEGIEVIESGPNLRPYEVLGTVMVEKSSFRSQDDAVLEMKKEAAKVGADALLDVSWGASSRTAAPSPKGLAISASSPQMAVATIIRWVR